MWKTSDEFPGSISLPFGIKTSHTWHEVGQILRIINDLDIKTFIELGTHVGGLASIISCITRYREDFSFYGFEKDRSLVNIRLRCPVYSGDVFDSKTIGMVVGLMEGRSLIYCDNGDKVREMEVYHTLLKRGDVIMCHDYFNGQYVNELENFGFSDECGCKPEVSADDLAFLFHNPSFTPLPDYLLKGTRIMGFVKGSS